MIHATLLFIGLQAAAPGPPNTTRLAQCRALTTSPEQPNTVRGRLYAANGGGSGFRIWIIGTERIVWLTPKIDPALPETIGQAFRPFEQDLYGDFTFVPLAPDRPGVMREVCFVSGKNLVVRPSKHPIAVADSKTSSRQWSEAEFRWLETWREAALDALMPVVRRSSQNIAYRRYRDLYHEVPEVSFSIELAARGAGRASAATLTEPVGPSIQEQLLALHAGQPDATLQTLLPRVALRRLRIADRPCRPLDAELHGIPRMTPQTLRTDVIVLHPLIQRLVINTPTMESDITVFESTAPIAKWADRTIAAIRGCAATRPSS